MTEGLNVRGESSPRNDPYRFWLSGILVELGVFAGFSLLLFGVTALIVVVFGS